MYRSFIHIVLVVQFGFLLINCGGDNGGVGNQNDQAPVATAEVFGASQATSGSVDVRSGKDVMLSGFNSDGVDDPLLTFSWQQIDTSGFSVDFYERASNSVVFTAPAVPLTQQEGVELQFELTVTDGDGVMAKDQVAVNVKPAYDADQFLLNPRVDERFVLIVAAPENTSLATDIPFVVNMSTTAHWHDRIGNNRNLALNSDSFTGTVIAGDAPAVTDPINAYFKVAIPLLDADDINVNFTGEERTSRLEFENVDSASITISLSLFQQATGAIAIHLARETEMGAFELIDTTDVMITGNTLEFTDEWLRQNLLVESRRSANNYYDCIDPNSEAETLTEWISYAGFNAYPESVVHTSYVNNYDLNFGRDMYVRKDENGNVYTYVTNYPSLENIFSGRNEFAIVVMEYSAAPTGNCGDGTFEDDTTGKKIVKFYSYVPDEISGEYVRAPSMNFDGRGERMVPGVCVACHYGDTNSDQFNRANLGDIDATAADLNSSFIPWDLDAFLYTRGNDSEVIDPVYASAEISSEVTQAYSREAQESAFRQQNQMILDTFTHDINNLKRFEIPIKLIHGWYGNRDLVEALNFGSEEDPLSAQELLTLQAQVSTVPANPFDGDYVQSGWEGQEQLYHEVFARNCRLCHAQVANHTINFDSYEEFINNELLVDYVFEQGAMPLSRLTMDRFWIDFYGVQAPAELLRDHLNSDNNPDNDVAPAVRPGYPVASVLPVANGELAADVMLDFDGQILFDGANSKFANAFEWSLDGNFVSDAAKFEYFAETPGTHSQLTFLAINTDDALVSRTETRRIQINDNTPQAEGVPAPAVNEGDTVMIDIYQSLCPAAVPDDVLCREVFGDIREGEVPIVELLGAGVNGDVSIVDAAPGTVTFTSTSASFFGDGEFSFTLTDSFGESSAAASVSITINSLEGPVIVGPDSCDTVAVNHQTEALFPIMFGAARCLDPSANDTVADGLSLQVVEVGVPLQTGSVASVDSGGVISYTPGRFFIGQDSFSYTVQDDSLSQRTNRGTVVVVVNANQTFTSLTTGDGVLTRVGLSDGCGECHGGNRPDAPNWLEVANIRLAATNTNLAPYGAAEMTLAEPTSRETLLTSILFQNACDALAIHPGGNRLCTSAGSPDDISDLNADGLSLLRWLEEGALDN